MKDEFSRFHPINNFVYFLAIVIFSSIFLEPIMLIISLLCGIIYSIYLDGKKSLKLSILALFPIALFAALVNIAFNHSGMTILAYLPSGNPITLESILYGVCAAGMLSCVIIWFFCLNKVITSDKYIYMFGKIMPALSLILSMVLRFVPLFKEQYLKVSAAQKHKNTENKDSFKTRLKHGKNVFSIMLTWSLENSIITADSMNSRGYGLKGRSTFSRYRFYHRDFFLLITQVILIFIIITLKIYGSFDIEFYPFFEYNLSVLRICGYIAYFIFCMLPLIINLTEDIKWNYFRSRI